MAFWRIDYNLDQRHRIEKVLRAFSETVQEGVGGTEFFDRLLAKEDGVPSFFRHMFEVRGVGGTYYGRNWEPLSESYLTWKRKHGLDTRIGFRFHKLFESLTDQTSFSIRRVTPTSAVFGTAVEDGGVKYAPLFNKVRPFADQQEMENLRAYLKAGAGKPAFDDAVSRMKTAIFSKVLK